MTAAVAFDRVTKRYGATSAVRDLTLTVEPGEMYGLIGADGAGYALGDPELLSWLDRIRMPFNVNLPAQEACIEALKDAAFVKKSVALAVSGRGPLAGSLRDLGFEVVDSATNFLFVKSPVPGRELFKSLLKLGVIVRPLDEAAVVKAISRGNILPVRHGQDRRLCAIAAHVEVVVELVERCRILRAELLDIRRSQRLRRRLVLPTWCVFSRRAGRPKRHHRACQRATADLHAKPAVRHNPGAEIIRRISTGEFAATTIEQTSGAAIQMLIA